MDSDNFQPIGLLIRDERHLTVSYAAWRGHPSLGCTWTLQLPFQDNLSQDNSNRVNFILLLTCNAMSHNVAAV